MKCTGSLGILCLMFLSACGQTAHQEAPVSRADSLKFRLYDYKSNALQNKDPDTAIYLAGQGLKLARQLHYKFGEALMLNRFARINEHYGNVKLAIKYQKSSLALFNAVADKKEAADATASMGILQARQGDFKTGSRLITNSLAYYKKNNDTAGLIRTYTRLGELYELNGNRKQALSAYSDAEQLNRGDFITDEYFSLITNIGKLHTELGNHRKAADYYEKGIGKSRAGKHIKTHIAFLNHAGKTWSKLGNKQKAMAYHQQGLEQAQANGLSEETAKSLIGMAHAVKTNDADQSIAHLKHALQISRSIGHQQLSAEIYYSLSDVYRQQSRYAEALLALQEHHRLLDSLVNANEGHKIAVLQSSYDLAESKLHIEALEVSNQERTYQRNEVTLVAIAILIILLVIIMYFYKNRLLNRQLTASNLIKDRLFSIIGHDLRNPIGGITQLLAIMEEGHLTAEEHQQMVTEMRKQGNITLEILNALLNWGEAQLKGVHIKPININAKTSIVKNITALHKQADDKSIRIIDTTPAELIVYGDPNHFDFIIRNLISNAIKFSHLSGDIQIAADTETDPDHIIFSVTDHGKGITKAQQELFLQSDMDVAFGTQGEKGTGIGLMLSKEFMKANHGRIWLESEEGKGSTFYFTFPKISLA
jgi:signal transduction histidine kinase